MKIPEKIKENKIFFITFFLLVITSVNYLLQKELIHVIDNYYFPLYVVNYECGYSSRLLVGAVFSLFFKYKLNVILLTKILIGIYFVLCFLLSLFINNYLKKTNFEALGIYAIFMTVTPAFLSLLRYMGIVDTFWLFFALGSMWAVNKKGLRWLVPIFCIISLAIHEVFITTYLPVIAIAVLYQFVKKPCISNFIFIAVCAVVVGIASVYFFILGDSTMKMTADEMVAFARDRLDAQGSTFDDFYLRSVFFWEAPQAENYHGFAGYLQYVFDMYHRNNSSVLERIIFFILSNLLSAIPFVYLILKSFKEENKPAKKFIFFCSLVPILLSVAHLMFSTDTERFSMHLLVVMLLLLLFFVNEKDSAFCTAYNQVKIKLSENKTGLAIMGIAIARIVLSGVRF